MVWKSPSVFTSFSWLVLLIPCYDLYFICLLVQQLAGLEESFAHGLQKLLRSAAYTLHTNTLMQWLGQDPFEETGLVTPQNQLYIYTILQQIIPCIYSTLKEAWKLIGECLSLTAKHHLEKVAIRS